MTEGYALIGNLLQLTYTSPDNTVRKQAEEQLLELSKSHDVMISTLLQLLSSAADQNLRQAAATRFRQVIRSALEQSILDSAQKCLISEQVFQILIQCASKSANEILGASLTSLISDSNCGIVATKISNLCNRHLNSSKNEILGSLICVKSLFSTISSDFSTKDYFDKVFPSLIKVGKDTLSKLFEGLNNNDSELAMNTASILVSWTETFSQILEHFEMISPKTMKHFIKQVSIAEIFFNILTIKFQGTGLAMLGTDAPTKEILKCKTGVLKCLNIIIQFTIDSKKKLIEEQEGLTQLTTLIGMDIPDSPFVSITWNYTPQLLDTIIGIGKEVIFGDIFEESQKEFIYEGVSLFQKCCGESRFFNIFLGYYKEIVAFIVINAFKYSEDEKDLPVRDPQEFVDAGMDICERQDSETIKTGCAKLLETVCDNIDGALTYVIGLVNENFFSIFEPRIQNMSNPQIYNFSFEEEEKIDCSILMISTLNYSVSKRADLVKILNSFLERYQEILINSRSGIIQSRMGLFLYFYLEHIHQNSNTHFFSWINFLVNCMTPANPFPVGVIQACETFSSLTQDEETMLRIHEFIEQIFNKLITCIPSQKQKNFFESLSDFLNWFSEISHDQILCTLQALVQKLLNEIGSNKMLAGKCWNVVRAILSSDFLITEKITEYEQAVTPVFKLLQYPEKLVFEEDILLAILAIITKQKKISSIQWEILSILPFYQSKQEDSLQGLLKLISSYILYGKNYIQDNPAIIEILCSMGLKALYSRKSGMIKENLCSEGATLIQLLLTSFPGYFDSFITEILNKVFVRYSDPPIFYHFFKIRLLQVFLAAFAYNFGLCAKILQESRNEQNITIFRYVIFEISQNHHGFKYEYDRKIAMIGFGHLLNNVNLNAEVEELAGIAFEVLILIMANKTPQDSLQSKKLNILLDKIMAEDIDSLTDPEIIVKGTRLMMSENANQSSEESESMINLVQVMTVFNDYDEYTAFRSTLQYLDQNFTSWIRRRISLLTETRKSDLIHIVSCKKIKSTVPGSTSAVRKIVKPKFRNK